MFKKTLLFVLILSSVWHFYAQDSIRLYNKEVQRLFKNKEYQKLNKTLLNQRVFFQREDNLEEFIYAQWEYFSLNPTKERFSIITKIDNEIWRKPKNVNEHQAYLHLLVNQGYYSKQFGQLDQVIIAYEKAWNYYQKHPIPSYNIIEFCLKPLATNCTRIGDYIRADEVIKRTLQLAVENNNNTQISATLGNLAINYHSQGKYKKAIEVLQQALEIPTSKEQESRLRAELAKNYLKIDKQEKATQQIEHSNTILDENKVENTVLQLKNYITKGIILLNSKEQKKAIEAFNKALQLAINFYPKYDREIAKIYNLIAATHFQNKAYTQSLESYQKSLTNLIPDYKPNNIYENPTQEIVFADNTIKEALDGRAACFFLLENDTEALKNYELSFIVDARIQKIYSSQYSKIIQQTEYRNRTEKTLEILYKIYVKTADVTAIEKAFLYTERGKSRVLKNEIAQKTRLKKHKNNSLIIRKKELTQQLAGLNAKLKQVQYSNKTPLDSINILIKLRDSSSNELQIINHEIQKKFKNDFSALPVLGLSDMQQKIKTTNTTIISYFVGEKQTYIFSLVPNKPIAWRIVKNTAYFDLASDLFTFYATDNGAKILNQIEDFKNISFQLYYVLLAEELTDNSSKDLIIIPDRLLSFIPFDALITNVSSTTQFEKIPFLVRKHNLSYAYATTILFQEKKKYELPDIVIGFFPEFKNNNRNLAALPHTLKEADLIEKNWENIFYKKEEASSINFINNTDKNAIIHLSTHAHVLGKTKEASIAFWDKSMSLSEIYGATITSELVVLSACETGIGQVAKGEGAMSLARGFSYAGVNNIVTSLWKVNDKATSTLMGDFYKHLAKNNSFENALQNAKLDYLDTNLIPNTKKSPYYWAGFVPIKNTFESFRIDTTNWNWSIFLVIIGVIFLFFIGIKIKKQRL